MAGDEQSDPFDWDEDRVVQELCTSSRSWKAPPEKRLPDPATLEARLRECGVDGESLLTYGDEFGFDQLWASLGIKKLPHRLSLKEAITQFRRRSSGYREWKAQNQVDSGLWGEEREDPAIASESYKSPDLKPPVQAVPAALESPGEGRKKQGDAKPSTAPLESANHCPGVLSPALSTSADHDLPTLSDGLKAAEPEWDGAEEPPSKKRRIAPTAVSTVPTGNKAFSIIPTEGDIFLRGMAETMLQADNSSGFLGTGILHLNQLTESQTIGQPDPAKYAFAFFRTQVPPGRRVQVSAAMKRFFRSGPVDRLRPKREPGEETPLPLFGESDDEGADSETWREYQQEEEERLAMEARKQPAKERFLSKDRVAEVVQSAIQALESRWLVEKKPKHDRKARKLWQDARRNSDRQALVRSAKASSEHLDTRVARLTKEIINQQWSVENDVRQKASDYLEMSVFDKMYQAWRIDLFESPRQPPKPSALPRPTPKPPKPTNIDDDEEILTSDFDDMDVFIEYDDNVTLGFSDEMEIDSKPTSEHATLPECPAHEDPVIAGDEADTHFPPPRAACPSERIDNGPPPTQPTPTKIKAEQTLVLVTPGRPGTSALLPIEIASSPSPTEQPAQVPGLDNLESLEKIGEIGVEYWEQVKDAKRLVVAVLCVWSRAKITRIYVAIQNHDHRELWARYVRPIIDETASATVDSVEFLLCRLFDVFVSKTAKRANSQTLRRNTCHRMDREGNSFARFCALLGRVVPLFLGAAPQAPTRIVLSTPAKEHIGEIRDPAADTSSGSESPADDLPLPSTRKRRRFKRRDKTAENLRIDNVKRNEELAQRRIQFHERMTEQGLVPANKSRLIVNDSKESDEQALIYINDHIGAKVKDHQVEGVRFMWNQVVVDSNVRQGCLLAHTMGLGKTMQVITLLVVIAESSASPDESVRSQIPESLRESKTLVLCPASLVDNWDEEIQMWAPGNVLGPTWRIDTAPASRRLEVIQKWASSGGLLIIGYTLFTNLVRGDEEAAKLLLEMPNLVIGDEAHYMKNPESLRHQATANFKTMNRIAMTGSPLTNNVMDYYAMINWVAPNYLADVAEFKERFANPIREGLYADSEQYHKRKARKMLHVLKATVEPKVHRRDIQVLLNELPQKKEFVITLPLTKVQMRAYQTYIEWVANPGKELMTGQARAWSLVTTLGPLLAHPLIFKAAEAQRTKRAGSKAQSSNAAKAAKTDEGDEDNIEIPQEVLVNLLATVAVREIEDYALSNKIIVLLRILEECREVRDKVLVFSHRLPTLDFIETICKRKKIVYQRLDGDTRTATRQESVKKFNTNSHSEVYLIATTAGGVGLNIYGANRVVIFDFMYTPAEEQQAIGRAYRLGQTKPVYVYWLTIGGTFEETLHNRGVFKTQLASRVVDKKNPDPWSKRFAEYFAMPKLPDQEDLSGALGQDRVLDALLTSEDVGRLIRNITSTETFEKEEQYELTPEEKREADEDIELERLRSQNPEEFRRREQERAWQSRTSLGMPPQPSSSSQPRSADAFAGPNPGFISHTADPFTYHSTSATVPVPGTPPSARGNTTAGQATVAPDSSEASNVSRPEPAEAGPQPILGTGTHFKHSHTTPPPELPIGSLILGSPSNSASAAAESLEFDFTHLSAVHSTLCREGRHVRYHPNDLINRVRGALAQSKMEQLPMMDKIQNLNKCSRNLRFAEAMLSGYIGPEQLASLSRLEMEDISTSLNGMAEAEFKQRVWTTKADINQMRTRWSATARTGPSGEAKGAQRDKGSRAVLRFMTSAPESQEPATMQDRRRAVKPGDSADTPQIID